MPKTQSGHQTANEFDLIFTFTLRLTFSPFFPLYLSDWKVNDRFGLKQHINPCKNAGFATNFLKAYRYLQPQDLDSVFLFLFGNVIEFFYNSFKVLGRTKRLLDRLFYFV